MGRRVKVQAIPAGALDVGRIVLMTVGGATCPTGVFVQVMDARVAAVTEKAVRLEGPAGSVWLPRAAIQIDAEQPYPGETRCRLARWFRPDAYQARVFSRIEVGGVSNAQLYPHNWGT